jgi:hypothetical protein
LLGIDLAVAWMTQRIQCWAIRETIDLLGRAS